MHLGSLDTNVHDLLLLLLAPGVGGGHASISITISRF
jgi:hypothetical protein